MTTIYYCNITAAWCLFADEHESLRTNGLYQMLSQLEASLILYNETSFAMFNVYSISSIYLFCMTIAKHLCMEDHSNKYNQALWLHSIVWQFFARSKSLEI